MTGNVCWTSCCKLMQCVCVVFYHDLKTRKQCEMTENYIIYGLRTSHKKPNCFTTRNLFLISDLISTVFMFRLKKCINDGTQATVQEIIAAIY